MERIAMSQEEREWLDWLKRAKGGEVTQRFAAGKMGISDRWVRSLLAEMKVKGDAVVVHGLRGRISNRRIGDEIRARAMEIVKSPDWHDFKPTFAAEQLAKRHRIQVSKETVRKWMIGEGVWRSKGRKLMEMHQWRPRRSHYGEMVQWDTSDHDWLEGRGEPVRHLVRMIDDATSRSWGRFVWSDGTRENMGVLWEYVVRFGRAVDYYTDRDSMFAVPRRPEESKEQQRQADRLTQIGRALRELGIGWIAAYSPEAKGRVERSFLTDQDRLIKELRLAKVNTMQVANEFLEKEYWPEWNTKFTQEARDQQDLHRPLAEGCELGSVLSHVEHRIITNNYTFPYYSKHYQIAREDVQAGMKRQSVRVELWLNGELKARYQGRYVAIHECGAKPLPAKTAPRKPIRKDHNAGGKSHWMDDFWNRPSPPLWQVIDQ
ncbi:MAG: ISNCY family transposase [Bryobacteraceae bacterium]